MLDLNSPISILLPIFLCVVFVIVRFLLLRKHLRNFDVLLRLFFISSICLGAIIIFCGSTHVSDISEREVTWWTRLWIPLSALMTFIASSRLCIFLLSYIVFWTFYFVCAFASLDAGAEPSIPPLIPLVAFGVCIVVSAFGGLLETRSKNKN